MDDPESPEKGCPPAIPSDGRARLAAWLLMIPGGLLVLRHGLAWWLAGRILDPAMASLGIALASGGAWLWLRAGSAGRVGPGLPLQIGAVLILAVWGGASLDLSRRETGEADQLPAPRSPGAASAPAPQLELSLVPAQFQDQTKERLVALLRAEGHGVRCYGDLKGRERIAPSITQVCLVHARRTWGLPVADVSFHFGGEELQMARYEFPPEAWPQVRAWFASEGQDAGSFGRDRDGNAVLGRHVAGGLLQTARPSRNSTVMVLWESRSLVAHHCRGKALQPAQRAILCSPPGAGGIRYGAADRAREP